MINLNIWKKLHFQKIHNSDHFYCQWNPSFEHYPSESHFRMDRINFENENKFCSLEIFQPVPCTFPDLRPLLFLSFFFLCEIVSVTFFLKETWTEYGQKIKELFPRNKRLPISFLDIITVTKRIRNVFCFFQFGWHFLLTFSRT